MFICLSQARRRPIPRCSECAHLLTTHIIFFEATPHIYGTITHAKATRIASHCSLLLVHSDHQDDDGDDHHRRLGLINNKHVNRACSCISYTRSYISCVSVHTHHHLDLIRAQSLCHMHIAEHSRERVLHIWTTRNRASERNVKHWPWLDADGGWAGCGVAIGAWSGKSRGYIETRNDDDDDESQSAHMRNGPHIHGKARYEQHTSYRGFILSSNIDEHFRSAAHAHTHTNRQSHPKCVSVCIVKRPVYIYVSSCVHYLCLWPARLWMNNSDTEQPLSYSCRRRSHKNCTHWRVKGGGGTRGHGDMSPRIFPRQNRIEKKNYY